MRVLKHRKLLVAVAALLALGGAVGWALLGDSTPHHSALIFYAETDGPQLRLGRDDAIARASARAGYAVQVPSVLPDSRMALTGIVVTQPADVPHAIAITSVFFAVPPQAGDQSVLAMQIDQIGTPFEGSATEPVDIGVPGASAFTQTNAQGMVSYFVTGERSYLVMLGGSEIPPQAAVIPMLRDLARQGG